MDGKLMPSASDGSASPAWRSRILTQATQLAAVLSSVHRIAVIGIKPANVGGPAFYVPEYLQRAGYDIVPVPVYYPEVSDMLGVTVQRSLQTVVPAADMVLLFRRSVDVVRHLDEILAAKPRVVWMQQGIQDADVAETLAKSGIDVVQDRCAMVEHRDLLA